MIAVAAGDVVPFAQQVDEVAPAAAAGIDDPHAPGDPAAQELVEYVDVDVAELVVQRVHAAIA